MVRLQPKTTIMLMAFLVLLVLFFGYSYYFGSPLGLAPSGDKYPWSIAGKSPAYNDVGVSIKNLKPGSDGNLELTISLKLADIVRFLDSFSNGGKGQINPNDPTSNPVIPNIEILMSPERNHKIYDAGTFAVVFVVGTSNDLKHQQILEEEQKKYFDIVQGDFHDAYRNLTLKTVVGLKWISTECLNADYYVKADDDAFINVFEWMKMAEQTRKASSRFIMCPMWQDKTMPILRDPEKCMKWCVKYTEFPGRSHFPGYCAGLALMMSHDIVKEMYETAQKTHFFWIDDVFLTGIVSRKLPGVYYKTILRNFTLKANEAYKHYLSNDRLTIQLSHVKDYRMFKEMWTALLKRVAVTKR